ncbi:MAG: Ada metal-binding domain-containing protein [Marinoscillum sp.]
MIRNRQVQFAGNSRLKIFGLLGCKSGKRMKKSNRIFFSSQKEAELANYRPCGHCMNQDYQKWNSSKNQ